MTLVSEQTSQLYLHACGCCSHTWRSYLKEGGCGNCGNSQTHKCKIPEPEIRDQIDTWLKIGRENPWIAGAWDPDFSRDSFCEIKTLDELKEVMSRRWGTGTAFYYKDICFINQDMSEWLTIRYNRAFESMSMKRIVEAGEFEELMARLLTATEEQCIRLKY